ncbi:MAG: Asp-tRNA(Asn)/Glu-tRNA(Gln) amidotransferase subunit GatC [Candidatus Neptunochlamydia sp.]|nr:Asp-tRNA(Asn)/Glu-tRNA(Gln) amidotransferase subunit GatC [Candidatus Neptunochlamydia sp.]
MYDLNEESLGNLTKLCRINCSDEELETLLQNLKSILGCIDQLKEVDTEDVPVCNHVSEEVGTFMREDEVTESLDRNAFLENSPSHIGGMVRVPTVIKL